MDEELREHLRSVNPEEVERLEATVAALRSVPDEEIPRRIAFVSDKVFEPKWWQRFPVWGLASAAMLSGAILTHGWMARPVLQATPTTIAVDTSAMERQMNERLDAALREVRAENEARVKAAIAETEKRMDFEHRATMLAVEENFNLMRKQMNRMFLASAEVTSDAGASR